MKKQQFRRGYNKLVNCRICGKQTHSNLDGCEGLDLCRPCRLAAELENEHFDGHHEEKAHADCEHCKKAAAVVAAPAVVAPEAQKAPAELVSQNVADEQPSEPCQFRIHFQKEGDVARALVGAGFGWLSDNGNVFNSRSSFACQVFENALVERDNEDPNRVRRFVKS